MPDYDSVLATIRDLAEAALTQAGTPAPVTQALRRIVALAEQEQHDTPEPSDVIRTDNQTL